MKKLVALALVITLVFAAVGCSPKTPPPEETINNFMSALVKADYATIAKLIESNQSFADMVNTPDEEEAKQLIEAILAKVTHQTGTATVTGDTATVALKVTAPNLAHISGLVILEVMPTAFALALSGAADADKQISTLLMTSFLKHIKDDSAPKLDSEISVKLIKKNNTWLLVPDDALVNAITGNLQAAWAELDQEGK